jgi:HNH endonuclease
MRYIAEGLKELVIKRAHNCCEYCLLANGDYIFAHQIDHIIALRHRGSTQASNLCLSCFSCNNAKGTDLSSVDWETEQIIPLYNPRRDQWGDHFSLDHVTIQALSPVGRVTVFLLDMNSPQRILEREKFWLVGRYPCHSQGEGESIPLLNF